MKSAGDLEYVTFQKTKWQTQLLKRDIEMVDSTNLVAMVTLWGVHAEETNVSNNPVLVIREPKYLNMEVHILSCSGIGSDNMLFLTQSLLSYLDLGHISKNLI